MHYFFSPLADWDTFCCQCVFVCLYLFVPWHSSLHGMTVLWLKQFKMLKICNVAKGQRRPSACVTHNKAAQQHCDCLLDPDVTWGRCMTSLIAKASFCEISWFFFFSDEQYLPSWDTTWNRQERNYTNEKKMTEYNKTECINI